MILRLVAAGTKPPQWIRDGYLEYARRLRNEYRLELTEVPLSKRGKNSASAVDKDGERILEAVKDKERVIALDVKGELWSTDKLAENLSSWRETESSVSFLIGGPDGLSSACMTRSDQRWSLGRLTLPHLLVRVVVAEQLYRCWSIMKNHPYHRR